jgi:hypothetical protein
LTNALALGLKATEKRRLVEEELHGLGEDLTLQQFLYDSSRLTGLLPKLWSCFALYSEERSLDARSLVLLHKMLAHDFYGRPETWQTAVQMMLKAERLLRRDLAGASAADSQHARWYRIFLLDHAANRMRQDDVALRAGALHQVENLLPSSLKILDGFIDQDDTPFVLRAAHYWGHRANAILGRFQRAGSLDKAGKRVRRPSQTSLLEARRHYELAIRLRLAAMKLSFDEIELDVDCAAWAPAGNLDGLRRVEMERLYTRTQGIADLANQFGALSCLLCYSKDLTEGTLDEIGRLASMNDKLWSQSRTERHVWEDKPRTNAWSRMAGLMVEATGYRRSKPMSNELSTHQKEILERFKTSIGAT